ncbi:MAG: DUF58 domain-containing protein [Gemmatimonadales bacterium]
MATPSPAAANVLDASVVAAIEDLELAARLVVEGLRAGGNRSPFRGAGTEFREHRAYRAGDDLKYLDWKLFARSDRLYTRQFRETTNLSVLFVLDTSASMAFPEERLSKFRYATIVTAALAHLAEGHGHATGFITMEHGALSFLPARGGRAHLRSLIARIDGLVAGGSFDAARCIARGAELLKRRGVMIVLSDFYDAEEETRRALRHAAQHGHDVAMFQVISRDELDLPYGGQLELEDLESGAKRVVDAAAIASPYRVAVAGFLERCRREAARDGLDYALLSTDVAPGRALRDYLLEREARAAPERAIHAAPR